MQTRSYTKSSAGLTGIAGAVLFSAMLTPSYVSADVSANIGVVSNYYFRGVTQTDDATAVQGGLDYTHESGFYAGTWASNVDFGSSDDGGDDVSYEIDLYLGYGGEIEGLAYDIGYLYYAYPDSEPGNIDFGEVYGELGFGLFSVGLAVTTNSEVSGDGVFNEGDIYYYGGVDLPLEDDFSLGLTVGFYDFADDGEAAVGDANYAHVAASLAKDAGDLGAFSFNLEFADIDENDALGDSNSDDAKVWLGWSKEF